MNWPGRTTPGGTPGRSMLSRVFREKRRVIVPLAIAAIANLAALLLIVYPLSRRVAATEQQAADVTIRLAAATNQFRAARATQEGRSQTDEQLARFYQEVLPRDMVAARRLTYLRLARLAREANLEYDHREFRLDEAKTVRAAGANNAKGSLTRLDITFPLSGQYRDIRRFIHTLETAPEFIVISDVGMQQGSDDQSGGPLSLELRLATYYRTPDEP